MSTIAGTGTQGFNGDGTSASAAQLNLPSAVTRDTAGNLYVADTRNRLIRMITPAGAIRSIAGTGEDGLTGDGGPATAALLNDPEGIAVDGRGNIFIAEPYSYRIRKVSSQGIITTYAGNCTYNPPAGTATCPGNLGDGGPATQASVMPLNLSLDGAGNLYVMDIGNNRIRKIDPDGTITTVAGNGDLNFAGGTGDGGPATAASFGWFSGMTVDSTGDVFISDQDNQRVRMVEAATGTVSTIAGNGTLGFSGDGGPATQAQLLSPHGLVVDASGTLYVADANRIRAITCDGIITTIAGGSDSAFSGDGGPAIDASFLGIVGLSQDPSGDLYIVENDSRVRLAAVGR